jgi:putative toxin-antitoxin system antitoxin component (TIGR02293 family)
MLGIRSSDIDWKAFSVRGGIPSTALEALAHWGAHANEQQWVTGSAAKGDEAGTQLSPSQEHRCLQLAWVLMLAVEVFGDKDLAINWLYKTRPLTRTSRHIDILNERHGVKVIEDFLVKIDSGYAF